MITLRKNKITKNEIKETAMTPPNDVRYNMSP